MAVPTYQNYMIYFSIVSVDQKFWVALHPLTETKHDQFLGALLNGLEIQDSKTTGNLAGLNPQPPLHQTMRKVMRCVWFSPWQASIHNLLHIKL